MAVDICSENSSPRLSFSDDLTEADLESHHGRSDGAVFLNSAADFDFCLSQGFSQHISSADELFANGKILPAQIKKGLGHSEARTAVAAASTIQVKVGNADDSTKKKRLIEFLSSSSDADEEDKPLPRPFWQFRRSSSLNCDDNSGGRTNRLLRSLQFLTRSNSTGSALNQKPSALPKARQKQHLSKATSLHRSNSLDRQFPCKNPWMRSSLRKSSSSRVYGNGVGISPVLNISPTYIAKGTVTLFGFGSFLCSSKKSKKKKKKK